MCPDHEQGAHDTAGNQLPGLILSTMSIDVILDLCGVYFQDLKVGLKSLLETQEKKKITFRERREVCSAALIFQGQSHS